MNKQLLIVDDDPFLVSSLSRLLLANGFKVISASTIVEGYEQILIREPNLAILDLSLPDGDGNELCRKIREKYDFPILMLSSRAESIDKVTGLTIGADDYLTKPFDPHELVARIHALLRRSGKGGFDSDPQELKIGNISIDLKIREISVEGKVVSLTQTEFDVLAYLAKHRDQVVPREQLFRVVWGYDSEFASNSLDVLVYRIRTKIKAAGGTDLITTVRGFGFRLRSKLE